MDRKVEGSQQSADESDSGEKMSTDEVDSHNWSDDESKDELDGNKTNEDGESETDSISESDDDKFSLNADNGNKKRRKRGGKRKRLTQSDTETRKLLDDVGDDEDYLLEETKETSQIDPRFFEMSEDQIDYYTKSFLYLQRKTQEGQASISGAVNGADDRVVDFFRKSRLDTHTLSRIWGLSDTNEDGFLNHSEFMLAMHLIVLHVKGNVPVPSKLPSPVRPCITPTRLQLPTNELQNSTASSTLSSTADNASTSRASEPQQQNPNATNHFHYFQGSSNQFQNSTTSGQQQSTHFLKTNYTEDPNPKHHSLSDDHLHVHSQREPADFIDAPPVLVDSRPMALNATTNSAGFALLNSLASRGPPPIPPQRQYNTNEAGKGHGRSASLDLNTLAAVQGQLQRPNPTMFHSTTASASRQHTTVSSVDESFSASPFTSSGQFFAQTPPAPPLRPQQKQPALDLQSKSTQTDPDDMRQASLDENTFAALLEGAQKMSPVERCRVLRLYNAELENERATLAQIRLQLQLRLDEAEQALKNHGIQVQPLEMTPVTGQSKAPLITSPKPTIV